MNRKKAYPQTAAFFERFPLSDRAVARWAQDNGYSVNAITNVISGNNRTTQATLHSLFEDLVDPAYPKEDWSKDGWSLFELAVLEQSERNPRPRGALKREVDPTFGLVLGTLRGLDLDDAQVVELLRAIIRPKGEA